MNCEVSKFSVHPLSHTIYIPGEQVHSQIRLKWLNMESIMKQIIFITFLSYTLQIKTKL